MNEYEVYHYMEADDLEDVKELLGELTSVMLILGSSEIDPSEVGQIAQYLKALSRSLGSYTESYAISVALSSLSDGINENSQRFQEIAKDLSSLSSAFVSDLQSWFNMTFYEGAPSLNFMDDTIVANTQTICAMLHADDSDASEEDMDDIFDF
ncbi:hypothetical protein JHD50_07310 [Sulfurimonas sp. MAG313]|nr:hypothetical protein [Sulfurimonas sp. MAG313]MDF1881112.1 hypothetical protein [Sulfurimonas sp. MAG313]